MFLLRGLNNKLVDSFRKLNKHVQARIARAVGAEICQSLDARNQQVMRQYNPRPYDGDLILMVATESDYSGVDRKLDPRLAWKHLTPAAHEYFLEGEHDAILHHPTVERMAEILSAKLGSAGVGSSSAAFLQDH